VRWLKRLAFLILGLVVVLAIIVAAAYAISSAALRQNHDEDIAAESVPVPTDSAGIERGRHLATAITKCVDCHTPSLGGQIFIDDPAIGTLATSNLTTGKGGVLPNYDDAHLERAIRDGIGWDGRPLLAMPSNEFAALSDEDVGAIIAYVRSMAPADNEFSKPRVGPLARVLFVIGKFPDLIPSRLINHEAETVAAITPEVTAAYGNYLATVGGCHGCHGAGLSGGAIPGTPPSFPPATNITPTGIGSWSQADFTTALREGKRPDGSAIAEFMPWRLAGQMTENEIDAIWIYLKTVEPKETGTR
jgi:mono/diheme cytochrome c family protein